MISQLFRKIILSLKLYFMYFLFNAILSCFLNSVYIVSRLILIGLTAIIFNILFQDGGSLLKVKSGMQKKLPGFQAQLVCLTPWNNGEPPSHIKSLTINSSYGL